MTNSGLTGFIFALVACLLEVLTFSIPNIGIYLLIASTLFSFLALQFAERQKKYGAYRFNKVTYLLSYAVLGINALILIVVIVFGMLNA